MTTRNLTKSLLANDAAYDLVLRQDPNYRLPYLYSLAIALTYTSEGRNEDLWKVVALFVTHDDQQKGTGITIDRALDTNILVVAVLKFAVLSQTEAVEGGRKTKLIGLLRDIVIGGTDWKTCWKSIYLAAGMAFLLSKMDQHEAPPLLVGLAKEAFEQVKSGSVPSDWGRKKEGLKLCQLESKVKSLGLMDKGVYEWSSRGNVPHLALYNPRRITPEPISSAAYWAVKTLQLER